MFDYAFKKTFNLEGGEVNDKDDRGGHTNFGVTQALLDRALRMGIVTGITSVSELTPALVRIIYQVLFWNQLSLNQVKNIDVAAEIFDTAINSGPQRATFFVQLALDYLGETLEIDGVMGPQTMGLINKWCAKDPRALYICLNGFQFIHFACIIDEALVDRLKAIVSTNPSQQKFARGWTERVQGYKEV
jgi:lysozyme family protein